jgi:lactate dehydrogenase-like 2-hydroxyacid dehydrogenase
MYPSPSSPTTASTTFLQCHKDATALSRNPRNHTLGVIGLGNVGKAIAKKAHAAFGMKILYFDVSKKPSDIESSAGNAVFYAILPELLGSSDCVVLATPSNPSGAKTINASTLAHFKPGSRFVNIARGSLVDEEALADAIEEGRLSAVMLDVHEAEPVVNGRLVRLGRERGNVMLTCHNAGGTVDTHVEFERLGMVNIAEVLEGRGTGSAVNLRWLRSGGEEKL